MSTKLGYFTTVLGFFHSLSEAVKRSPGRAKWFPNVTGKARKCQNRGGVASYRRPIMANFGAFATLPVAIWGDTGR